MRSIRILLVLVGAAYALSACDSPLPPEPESVGAATPSASRSPGPAVGPANVSDQSEARVRRGFALAPVPRDLSGKNPALVGLGSYLVHIHACAGCHTHPAFAPGGDPYFGQPEQTNVEGYMAGGRPFGPFTSRNITPRANGLPGGLTLEEFLLVMRAGADLEDGKPFLQVMPWPYTSHMTDRELHAIYEYLRAIPCRVRPGSSWTRLVERPGHSRRGRDPVARSTVGINYAAGVAAAVHGVASSSASPWR